jgi:hypothetical protein
MEVASLNVKIIGELPKVYLEGTLCLWMSLLKKREWHLCLLLKSGRDLTPNP